MSRHTRAVTALLLVVVLGVPTPGAAQSERGTISGVVTDDSKLALPGVSLNVTNTATNQSTLIVSSDSGAYSAANLPPGLYKVEATLSGFRATTIAGIQLSAGATARVDITLTIGAVTERVDVVANASFLQTEDARVSTNVSNQLIDQLPLVVGGAMRSVFDLVSTVAESKGTGNAVSLGGGQSGGFGATLDGISVNTNRNANTTETAFLTPSVEAITEFAVETNGFKPEFGQAAGGAITFASKSGTNEFHGSVYNFLRDESMDAMGFFATSKGVYNQNNFGGSWGGPVKLFKYDGRNRTFFFATYEGFMNETGASDLILSVPTPEMYNGDFSNLVNRNGQRLTIYDPVTTRPNPNGAGFIRDAFPNNIIPANRISAVARAYLALARTAVIPNRAAAPGTFGYINNNFISTGGSTRETTHKYSLKLDHTLTSSQRLSYLFNRSTNLNRPGDSGPAGLPLPFSGGAIDGNDADLHRASWDWTSARMVNHFSFGLNTFVNDARSSNVGGNWQGQGICIPNAVDCSRNFGQINFSGELANWGGAANNGTEQPRWTFKDDFSLMAGSHTMKMGVTFDSQEANGFGQQSIAGSATFDYRSTSVPGATTQTSGSSFASFLLGYAFSGSTETERYVRQIYPYWSFYAQDDWRIGTRLVVNYGLRYEFTQPPREGEDRYTDFDPTRPNPRVNNYPGALRFAGFGPGRENTRTLIPSYYGAVAPRLSLSYRLNDKTIARAGAGRSFGRVTVVQGSSHYNGHIGNYAFTTSDNGITPAFVLDQGLPAYPLPPNLNPAFDNNLVTDWWNGKESTRPSYYDSWTLSFQRDLRRGLTAEVDYNGSYGKALQAGLLNPNQVPMDTVAALIARVGLNGIQSFLNTVITSAEHAASLGIALPYPQFVDPAIQTNRTVAQALRPFPQYNTIRLSNGGGDKTGRSHYHAVVLKLNQRMSGGLAMQSSYTWSRITTDADRFSGSGGSLDAARPELEWSIGALDQTHSLKINTVYELPFGENRRWLRAGVANLIAGGWRVASSQTYTSGLPIAVTSNAVLNIFNGTNRPNVTGEPWRAPIAGSEFDPRVDLFLNRAAFVQSVGALGNAPRVNGDVRRPWNLNENISVAKTFRTNVLDFDVRIEAFNLLNRVVWGAPVTNFSNNTFGQITSQANTPRQVQLGLKVYW